MSSFVYCLDLICPSLQLLSTTTKHTLTFIVRRVENATALGEQRQALHGGFVLYYTTSLSRLRLHVVRLYLHCGILHWADI